MIRNATALIALMGPDTMIYVPLNLEYGIVLSHLDRKPAVYAAITAVIVATRNVFRTDVAL